jgi:uncharacterized protein YaaN involved in tellurite resistance
MSDAKSTTPPGSALSLSLPPIEDIEHEVVATAPVTDPELAEMADAFVRDTLALSADNSAQQRQAIDSMGLDIQRQAAQRSVLLQTPIRQLAQQGEDGGPVARSLLDLRGKMQSLDPRHHDLSERGMTRALSLIPGVGTRLQRYFNKFESAQAAIDAIIHDLEAGRDRLRRDNLTLSDDQTLLRTLIRQLQRHIELGRMIDQRLVTTLETTVDDPERHIFIEEELLFPLRQRIVDLQQQLAVSQQGVLALEVIIRNNRELIRGVDRALNVTVSALTVAVSTALALANQRLVLDQIESLNTTTSDLIAGTAKALRSQGVEIQTRSASTLLDMEQLEAAFEDVLGAIDEVSRYRREALPKLDAQIERLDNLAARGDQAITRMSRESEPKQ